MTTPMVRLGRRVGAAAFLLAMLPLAGHAQTVTGNFRGRVLSSDGSPVVSATVTATNTETGFSRATVTDAQGRYLLLGMSPGNYAVRAQAIGHRPLEKTGFRLRVGDEILVDFSLETAAVEVSEIPVVVELTPLIDAAKTGVSRTVGGDEVAGLPANGRNFTDFIGLAPTYTQTPKFGSGASIGTLGGGRNSGTVMNIDGVENTGSFFGGDPRGGDRLPIGISIEAVKEFQVLTNDYDVSKGGFTGGLVNAVTKGGTNEFHGSFFEYYRSENLTRYDFLGNPPKDFLSHQFGLALSGPVIRDRLHFYVAVDRQARREPATAIASNVLGIPDSIIDDLDNTIRTAFNVDPGARGTVNTETNEWALFGRLDFNISSRHRIAIRDNLTILDLIGDRVSTGSSNQFDYFSNGGPQKPSVNSFAVNLFSNFSSSLYNELRVQVSSDPKPRPPEVPYPQVRVFLGGHFIAFGADSILHYNDLKENTLQIANTTTWSRGGHSWQLGFDILRKDFFNLFFNNGRGTYTFNWGADSLTLDSLAARHASAFTRAIPVDSVTVPTADYDAWRHSFFVQDRWQVTERLTVNAGVRLDVPKVSNVPRNNPLLLDSFPQFFLDSAGIARIRGGTGTATDSITTAREVPASYNWQPRVGLALDVWGDRRTILRGGAGMFYGYTPFVYWSNMFLNTGRDQLNVVCASTDAAAQNVDLNRPTDFASISPLGCGPAAVPAANAFFFTQRDPVTGATKSFRTPVAFKTNIGIDHGVTRNFRIGAEVAWAETYHNYSIRDLNYRTDNPLILTGEGGRKVVGTAPGSAGSNARRIDTRFIQVLEHDNRSFGDYVAVIASATYRAEQWELNGSYTYSRARDDISVSCCTSTTSYRLVEAGSNTNNELPGNFNYSDNDRTHYAVVSGLWRTPFGVNVGMIWRVLSGLPFSPTISSSNDANGDGIRGNDRVYVPRDRADISIDGNGGAGGTGTAAQQDSVYNVLNGIIGRWACLRESRGRIALRNSCRNASRSLLDLKLSRAITLPRGQSVEVVADFFNVLNGLNEKWGKGTSAGTSLMRVRGFDAANNRYVYEVLGTFGQRFLESGADLAQFQAQVGLRYRF